MSDQLLQRHGARLVLLLKIRQRPQFQGNTAEGARHFGERHLAPPAGGVNNHNMLPPDRLQHDKMVQIPVQHTGQAQLAQLVQIQAQRAACQLQAPCHIHQLLQRRAFQRRGEAAAQREHIEAVSVKTAHHAEAGEAAFRRFILQQ